MGTFSTATKLRSLADDLRSRSDEQLHALFIQRPDLMHPVPSDLSQLATRAATNTSSAAALDSLNQLELTLCEVLAVLPDGTSLDLIMNSLAPSEGFDREAITAALAHLWELGLVWGNVVGLHLVRSVLESFGKFPCALGPEFALIRRDVADFVASPNLLNDLIQSATDEALVIIQDLAWINPQRAYANAQRSIKPETATTTGQWLLAHGLLVALDDRTVVMPREVALIIRGHKYVSHLPTSRPEVGTIDYPMARVDSAGIHCVLTVLSLVEEVVSALSNEPISPLKSGGIAHRDFSALAEASQVTHEVLAAILEISFAAGLISCDEQEGWMPSTNYDRWLTSADEVRWESLATAWLIMDRAPHLVTGETIEKVNALSALTVRPNFSSLRRSVLDLLQSFEPGRAITAAETVAILEWLQPRRISALRHSAIAALLTESELLGITGAGALTSFGRLIVAGADSTSVLAKQLPDFVDHIIVQADLTALAPGRLPVTQRRNMALIAETESSGVATTYRFTPASILRAIDHGKNAADLKQFLAGISRTEIPQPLIYLIDDVARKHGHLRIGHATMYLRCDDINILVALLADKRLKPLRLRHLAEGILITEQSDDIVLRKLREAGYSPTAENADGTMAITAAVANRAPVRSSAGSVATPNLARLISAAIKSVRAGDRATQVTDSSSVSSLKTSTKESLEILNQALQAGLEVWISYADKGGLSTARIVEPLTIAGGFLTAFDTRSSEVKTFTISRISGAQFLEAPTQGQAQ